MMGLPIPNLDDRTWRDIIEEAIKMIPTHCPEWTDHNPSDPGITILELMAWMTEMIIYRLNRVPEKNYIKFLELMGTSLRTSQPAQTWLVFTVASGAKQEDLPAIPHATRVSTSETKGEPIIFETIDPLNLTSTHIIKAFSQFKDNFADHTSCLLENQKEKEVPIFFGEKEVPHILYVGDPQLTFVGRNISLKLDFILLAESLFGLNLEWECWDGKEWNVIVPVKDETLGLRKSGEIVFDALPEMEAKKIEGHNVYWLRARLAGMEGETFPKIASLKRSIEARNFIPEKGYISTEKIPFFPVDFSGIIYPFGKEPRQNDLFYVGSKIFSLKEAQIQIKIVMPESFTPLGIDTLKELKVVWEYFSEKGDWELLGLTSPTGVIKSEHNFLDETDALTKSGLVQFSCPRDVASTAIQGEERFWIRARIVKGNYGTEKENPPLIKTFLIDYREKWESFKHCLTYNYFSYKDLTPLVMKQRPFEPFEIMPEKAPAFYLAFDSSFSNKAHRIYFRVVDRETALSNIFWEYLSGKEWKELKLLKDTSCNFSQNGAIEFIAPADWTQSSKFEKKGYWLRARWETGSYSSLPYLKGVHLNAVEAKQAFSVRNEILGSSNGEPYQSFSFSQSPVLPEPQILIKEIENPSEDEVKKLKYALRDDVVEEIDQHTRKVLALWIRWYEIENFFNSTHESRHYTFDPFRAVITFGDGRRGKIPPVGRGNIKCAVYYVGGGARGNVGESTLTLLETAFPYVEAVRNPDPASGGSDTESIEDAKLRGPWLLKHRYRAVTKEDYEKLALEASGEVAKAMCFMEKEGEIKLIILPYGEEEKLLPRNMLIQKVKAYLDERRLITARVKVIGPSYTNVSIELEVVIELRYTDRLHEIKIKMEERLRRFFHPLKGGPKGDGWPMGRSVHISEIYYLLERIRGVDYIEKVVLNKDPWIKKIGIDDTGFPYLKDIDIKIIGG
jgi:hypothetical protein